MTKYLKHLNSFVTTYSTGRTDVLTISAEPGKLLLYDDMVNDNNTSDNYNADTWDEYITKGYWTVINSGATWNNFIASFAPVSSSSFIFDGGGAAAWPIIGASGNFTFSQGSYISGTGDQFIVTQTGPSITGGTLPLNVQSNQNAGATADYNCTVSVNGQTLTAVLTIEYAPQGS
jgi:hypothetical protein